MINKIKRAIGVYDSFGKRIWVKPRWFKGRWYAIGYIIYRIILNSCLQVQ